MMRRLAASLPIVLLALQAGSSTPTRTVQRAAELTREPGGDRLALLTEGQQVTIVEPGERWTRVRVEGWVATTDLEGLSPVVPSVPGPLAQAPPAAPATTALTGSIFVVHEGKTLVGRSTAVRLVSGAAAAQERTTVLRGSCDARHKELADEAASLKRDMDKAMKHDDASAAFAGYDKAKWARRDVLETLRTHDAECLMKLDESLRQTEAARALSSDAGAFAFPIVPPGDYLLVAWIEAEQTRFVWEVPVALQTGQQLVQDLTNQNLTRSTPLPIYK